VYDERMEFNLEMPSMRFQKCYQQLVIFTISSYIAHAITMKVSIKISRNLGRFTFCQFVRLFHMPALHGGHPTMIC